MDDSLLVAYLYEYDGDIWNYRKFKKKRQRPGQAFFNSLSVKDQMKILHTSYDTFYMEDQNKLEETVWFLMHNQDVRIV